MFLFYLRVQCLTIPHLLDSKAVRDVLVKSKTGTGMNELGMGPTYLPTAHTATARC